MLKILLLSKKIKTEREDYWEKANDNRNCEIIHFINGRSTDGSEITT